ncbi:MBL fold metallo-hydrolase [Sphingomonas abietis]|uniref:MBL fold metallo-hydrolase n=1 Tax=Sphingomonas abietis TaxID=3012344 RepID=A0ABY7NJM5_9SPHN|nr:MBL fold metallo-hydrolase [Sphingomonas abietis]WBO21731.1 MBL fold metallo-hydrolase [Sphingomonas abietis]
MEVVMVQHPVGQGGMTSGELRYNGQTLRWVYDCGSNQTGELTREVVRVAAGGEIDLLFLSHLDSDHVRGVDQLLLATKVRQVVLPYLDETAVLVAIARDAARGTLTGTFLEATTDPAAWFGSRGVETVTFVNGADDDGEGGGGPILPGEPRGGGEGRVFAKWSRDPVPLDARTTADQDQTAQSENARANLGQVQPGAALMMAMPGGSLNWVLIPYVHVPSAKRLRAFDQALEAEFGKPLDKKAIAQSGKDRTVRDKLRDCYDALWGDHNLISMTLYAGPWTPENFHVSIGRVTPNHSWFEGAEPGGWILTGDAHLDQLRRRQRFLHFYRDQLPLTNIYMVPHHGSIHNHSDEVLEAMPNLRLGFAAAGANIYDHPHDAVRDAVSAQPTAGFLQVSESLATRLVMDLVD